MSLKILHTADVHLGAKFLGLGSKGQAQRARLLDAFERTVDAGLSKGVDLFIVAGDLFDANLVSRSLLAQAAAQLSRLSDARIPVCLTPGTHDPFGPDSIYNSPELASIEGLTVFKNEVMTPFLLPDIDCVVYGSANMRPFEVTNPLESLDLLTGVRYHVGILHACFEIPDVVEEDTYMVTAGQIAASGLDYLALGHLHGMSDRSSGEVTAYYSGSPELVRMQAGEAGYALMVELDGGEVRVEPLKTGALKYEELNIEAEEVGTAGLTSRLLGLADADMFLQVNVTGLRPAGYPDPLEVLEELSDDFFMVKVSDRTSARPETLDAAAHPEGSPASRYLRIMEGRLAAASPSEEEEVREAMTVGLSLLLEDDA
jgi:DNA repair exonuclease SbcCD nuclease subunit